MAYSMTTRRGTRGPRGIRRVLWSAVSGLIVVALASLLAQTPAPQQPPPTFRTEANYVRVDAYPTNKDGTPVTDLRQEDFEILENGAPQEIEQFEHVVIRGNVPQDIRTEPTTVRESRAMADNSRARGTLRL